jgi:uncharacterized protein YabN with tetrapyrrole methylase and pyrophosphatase domain
MTHDTFEETPLGKAFEELEAIRKEAKDIIVSSPGDVFRDGPHPLSIIASVLRTN